MAMAGGTRLEVDADRFAYETIDAEVIVIDRIGGIFYSLRGSACVLWPALANGVDRDRLVHWVAEGFLMDRAAVQAAVEPFLGLLLAEGILQRVEGEGATSAEKLVVEGAFEPPTFEKFTDMQDLLTMDPLHEVDDEEGWPSPLKPARRQTPRAP
jgi:hypothetical protein